MIMSRKSGVIEGVCHIVSPLEKTVQLTIMRSPRNPTYVFLAILGLCILAWFVHTYPPLTIFQIGFFLIIQFLTSFFFFVFLLKIPRRAVLISIGISGLLMLRLLGLTEYWYLILFVAILISLELMLQKR